MDYDQEEAKQLRMLNNSNWDIVDDGKLSEHHMWTVRFVGGHTGEMEVHEDVVREAEGFEEAMVRFEARKRAKAKRVAKKRARAARASDGSDETPAAAAAQEALPVVEGLPVKAEMAAASPASPATVVTPAASASSSSSSSSSSSAAAADPDEELKAKRDELREKRRRIDAEDAAIQAELDKRAKKRKIQTTLDAAEDKAKTAAAALDAAKAEVDRLRAELEKA